MLGVWNRLAAGYWPDLASIRGRDQADDPRGLVERGGDLRGGHRNRRRNLRDRTAALGGVRPRSPPERALVAIEDGSIVGWVALSPTSPRACYAGVVEHSIYVAEQSRGHGIGRTPMEDLLAAADEAGIWTIQTSIFPENTASLALHEQLGFRVVGRRERVAQLNGVWRDTILLELRLERSAAAGEMET